MTYQEIQRLKEALHTVLETAGAEDEGENHARLLHIPELRRKRYSVNDDVSYILNEVEKQKVQYLTDVELALARIDEGSYGVCECGDKIRSIILLANPIEKRCIKCQKMHAN